MINQSELRAGNWVLVVWNDGYEESEMYIKELPDNDLPVLANSIAEYQKTEWKYIFPLPIYEWHLEDAGFKSQGKDILIKENWSYNMASRTLSHNNVVVETDVRYLHHLQNLIHTISGEEIIPGAQD